MLVHDLHITVIDTDTGEILRDLSSTPPATTNPAASNPDHPKAAPDAADGRNTPDINEVARHPLTMSRDFTVVAGAGFEPATSGL